MDRELRTARLILRPQRPADAAALFAHRSRPEVAVPGGFLRPRSLAETRRAARRAAAEWRRKGPHRRMYSLFLRRGGAWIGAVSLRWPHHGVGELGYGIEPAHQGNGYATEAVRAVVRLAFRLGAHRVQATCWVRNAASAKVLARAGLRKEGRLSGYLRRGSVVRDEFMFGLARRPRRRARRKS